MSWSLDLTGRVWRCSSYSDLNYSTLMNLAEYGQPMSPYETGYSYDFEKVVDFKKVTIEMPQHEVMTSGFGRKISPYSFPVVNRFLSDILPLACGAYRFKDLVASRFARPGDRIIATNLYGDRTYGIDSGAISVLDAAHIYGSVAFALRESSRFIYTSRFRRVEAEIGALDDNWDYNTANDSIQKINPVIATLFGPDHYNLQAPIKILFRGPGKRMTVSKNTPGAPKCDRTKSPRSDLP